MFPVDVCCRVLGISQAGYYQYRGGRLLATALRRVWLAGLIIEIHTRSRQTYEVRLVHAEMTLGTGVNVSKPTIEELMRVQGLQGIPKRKGAKHSSILGVLRRPIESTHGESHPPAFATALNI